MKLEKIKELEVADLVKMRSTISNWGKDHYYGLGIITSVGVFGCSVEWITLPWSGVERLTCIDKELLRKIEDM